MKSNYFEINSDELRIKLAELKKELFNLRFKNATGQLEDGNKLRYCKRNIARVMTILHQRDLDISSEPTESKKTKKSVK